MKTELTDEQKNELRATVADVASDAPHASEALTGCSQSEQPDALTAVGRLAEKGAENAAEKAKNSTGWAKIFWIILAALLAGVALFLETGCSPAAPSAGEPCGAQVTLAANRPTGLRALCGQITQEQMQVAGQVVHEIYHAAHPEKPCLAAAPSAARLCGAQAEPAASHPTGLQAPCILVLPVDDTDK